MDSFELWKRIVALEGQSLRTISQHRPFRVARVTTKEVVIVPEKSGLPRPIPSWKFTVAHDAKPYEDLQPGDVKAAGASIYHTTYVAAVVNAARRASDPANEAQVCAYPTPPIHDMPHRVPRSSPSVPCEPTSMSEDQAKSLLKGYLESNGWAVDIASGYAKGADIVASKQGTKWIVEVKGCGSRPEMRVNYFLAALSETLQRMCDPNAKYSVAFPDLPQFRALWDRLPLLAKKRTGITALFIDAVGAVEEHA